MTNLMFISYLFVLAYVRHKEGIWIKCDDHNLTTVSLNQVLDSEG